MIEIISALGILRQNVPLPTDAVPGERPYVLAEIIPFGAHIVFERVSCLDSPEDARSNGREVIKAGSKYIRILVKRVCCYI